MEARCLPKDRISNLPSILIDNIQCRVPIRDAVRTSILSRNWRYKWVTIPKLEFDWDYIFEKSNNIPQPEKPPNGRKQLTGECKFFNAIHQVLLLHQGPILEFTLSMETDEPCVEMDQIILHLSRKNTLKKLALQFLSDSSCYKLPVSVFSLHQLTDLSLAECEFDIIPTFRGFGNLTSLCLKYVEISKETTLHLISSCPLLERLNLEFWIPNAREGGSTLDLNELVKCMPVIKDLSVSSWTIECFPRGELPTTLASLKSLCTLKIRFSYKFPLLALFLLIRSSPSLEKIKLCQEFGDEAMDPEINSLDDYSDIWLEHLNELEITDFVTLELALEFVKLILARSPVLKNVRISLSNCVNTDEEVKILRILLCFPRASRAAKIIVER